MIYRNDSPNEVTKSSEPAPLSRADVRRGRIIAAARTLFSENGFHNTGIAQIAKLSGVLVGQIYRDFANKEEIVAEIVEHDIVPLLSDAALADAVAAKDSNAVLAWIANFIIGQPDHDVRLVAEIIAESSRNDRIAAIFRSVQQRLEDSMNAALEMLSPHPATRARRSVLADVILTMSAGVFQRRMGRTDPIDGHVATALVDMINREIALVRDTVG